MKHLLSTTLLNHPVKVALIGCGGNGSQMLTALARLDRAMIACGHPGGLQVTAYDPDNVSEANVGRQLFSPSDIGLNKASLLVHRLNCFYGLNWHAIPDRFERLGAAQIVISCVDSAASRRDIFARIKTAPVSYWLDLGNQQRLGQVILGQLHPPAIGSVDSRKLSEGLESLRLPHVMDLFPELLDPHYEEDDTPSCSLAESLDKQDLFINQALVTWGANLLWRLFRDGEIEHHGYFLNLQDGTVNPLAVQSPPKKKKKVRTNG